MKRRDSYTDSLPAPDPFSTREPAYRIAAWAISRRTPPTAHDLIRQFGMSRCNAYRHLRAMRVVGLLKEAP
ncbi:hypothetical protein [Pseudoxanthomonas sp. JBR18]|uniref:hypothetical protein n=1 Tax=Pseudoxanthomonas sp. JBR18 TaxID=2969308 RepID=UPI0023053CE1|nr:hypothetical protein [Pseudoxanthomonas sp. JBR18]WCE03162.1 hypothetical protein PJ250_13685 [Pseudoxanthomonas sp. JBR18]